jgi:hypothetical protein
MITIVRKATLTQLRGRLAARDREFSDRVDDRAARVRLEDATANALAEMEQAIIALRHSVEHGRDQAGVLREQVTSLRSQVMMLREQRLTDRAAEREAALTAAVLAARAYATEIAAEMVRCGTARRDGAGLAEIQDRALELEEFLSPGFGDAADLAARVAALRTVLADRHYPAYPQQLRIAAEITYQRLIGEPIDAEQVWKERYP